jgi:hypothetical protein
MPLSDDAKDRYIVPGMSAFTTATIEDMSETSAEQKHWVGNFLLNSIFRARVNGPTKPTLLNFLRRADAAFDEYSLARSRTLAYLASPNAVMEYLAAITHREVFLSQAYQAYCILDMGQGSLFRKHDGSVLERLNLLYGRAKHIEKAIAAVGQLPENGTLAIWLTNDGLRSTDSYLTFGETAEILRDLARFADTLQDPLTMREKLTATGRSLPGPAASARHE